MHLQRHISSIDYVGLRSAHSNIVLEVVQIELWRFYTEVHRPRSMHYC